MKKTYVNPSLMVVKIQPARFIADSTLRMRGDYNSNTVTMGARGSRFSDSDWEED